MADEQTVTVAGMASRQRDWPKKMRSAEAARYLTEVHGLPIEDKTLRNWRALERGPKCKYLGNLPIYEQHVLDHYAEHEALKEESPLRRSRRAAAHAQQAAA